MDYSFGAISRGSALATVEHRAGLYLLASVHGDLATIAIESIKASFARLPGGGETAAVELIGAAPSMIAASAAVALIEGDRAYIACVRGGAVTRQRHGGSEAVSGVMHLLRGDDLIVAGGPLVAADAIFSAPAVRSGSGFANDTLDHELAAALGRLAPAGAFAVSAVRVF